MSLSAGTRLGPYEILSLIGAGGMGEVYKARDTRLDRIVAVKVSKEQFSERFEREARAVAALNHPHICTLHDVGPNFLVMEFVEGRPLTGPLPLDKALVYAAQICGALEAAHKKGIVHRDLKPANILVTKAGIKLLDFGLAKQSHSSQPADADATKTIGLTKADTILGTLQNMSPEQLQGQEADERSDIYSFGCVLYEMLAGKRAFDARDQASLISSIMRDDPPPVSSANRLPAALDRVVKKCLAKDPDGRWQNAADLADELRWIASSRETTPAIGKRSRLPLVAAGLAVGLLLGAGAVRWLWRPAAAEMVVPRYLTYSGNDSSPAFSPDGKTVAFVSDRDGRARIWLKQVAGGSEVALTSGPDENPRFSPDGSTILFSRSDGPHPSLYRVSSLGGEARRILADVGNADFSPDGRRIAFLRWKSAPSESSVIGLTGVDGSGTKEIAEVQGLKMEFPRWSPDGTQIAMVGSPESDFRDALLVISEDGKNRKFVLPAGSGIGITSAAWLSNQELIYLTGDANTGTRPTLVRHHVESGASKSYAWAHLSTVLEITRGGNLVFDAIPTRCSLRELSSATSRWLARGNSVDREPAYSPDGKRIVFASNRAGNMDIWVMLLDTGTVSRVTDHPGVDYDPGWSPDGRKVIWSSDRNGHFEIYQAEVDGSGATRVTDDGKDAENPTMTRDGKWVIYASYHPNKLGIWKVHPDGSGAEQLAAGPYFNPEVSPDGEYALYLTSLRTDRNVIRVVRVGDGAKVPFEIVCEIRKRSRQLIGRARWAPDGKMIAFLGQDENGINGVYKQPFVAGRDTTSERSKLGGFDRDVAADGVGISPDGTRMIVAGWERTSSVMIAEQPSFLR